MSDNKRSVINWQDVWPSKAQSISVAQWLALSAADQLRIRKLLYNREFARTRDKNRAREVSNIPAINAKHKNTRHQFSLSELTYRPTADAWIDAFHPKRMTQWKALPSRNRERILSIEEFSFLDNPLKTIEIFQTILAAECRNFPCRLDFHDHRIQDVAPYLLLSMIYPKLSRFSIGGYMSPSIQRVYTAVGLRELMGIDTNPLNDTRDVYAFPVRTLAADSIRSEDVAEQVSRREKVQRDLVECINAWLGELTPSFSLTPMAEEKVGNSVGEALDNAHRHGDKSGNAGWWVTGFMARRDGAKDPRFVCHLAIINEGMSIADSLLDSHPDNNRFWPQFKNYTNQHKNKVPHKLAATILALQEGVSRSYIGPRSGQGISDLLEYVSVLGRGRGNNKTGVTILSGDCCIQTRSKYCAPRSDEDGRRLIWFNEDNDWKLPPDDQYVYMLPITLPGTIISIRFELDSELMYEAINDTHDQT